MVANGEDTTNTLPVPLQIQGAFRRSNFLIDVDIFETENEHLLDIHGALVQQSEEPREGDDFPDLGGWRILPKEPGSDPHAGVGIINTKTDSKGIETDYIFMPFYRINSSSEQGGVSKDNVVGAFYMIDQGDEQAEYRKRIEVSCLYDEAEDPYVIEISVGLFRYNARNISYRLRADLRTQKLLEYDGTRWGSNLPSQEASIKQLFDIFSQFREKWLLLNK